MVRLGAQEVLAAQCGSQCGARIECEKQPFRGVRFSEFVFLSEVDRSSRTMCLEAKTDEVDMLMPSSSTFPTRTCSPAQTRSPSSILVEEAWSHCCGPVHFSGCSCTQELSVEKMEKKRASWAVAF